MSAVKNVMMNYARYAELDEFFEKELEDAGYGGLEVVKSPVGVRLTVYVTRPGLVIGRRGAGIKALTERVAERFNIQNPQISVMEVEVPELNPRIMCSRIAYTVTKGTPFRRAAIWALNSIMNAGALGAEVIVSGKLRSERAHFEKYRDGIVPKSGETARKMVVEATKHVLLKMGLYGIKVRIALKDVLPPEFELKEEAKPEQAEAAQVEAASSGGGGSEGSEG
jgi:small subunit ribosomal protein S3